MALQEELRQAIREDKGTEFSAAFERYSAYIHDWAKRKGFWPEQQATGCHYTETRNVGEMIALMHSELSEALEAVRCGNPPDDKIPDWSGLSAELADCIIRIMDTAHALNLRVGEAIVAKMAYNETRPHKHGKAF